MSREQMNRTQQQGISAPGRIRLPLACPRKVASSILVFFAVFAIVSTARAQLYTGSVTGVVTDPSGAVVPSAKVTLEDKDKGYEYKTSTDASGRYLLSSIPPGTYRLTIEAAGFETVRREGIKLDVAQNVSSDVSLKIGAANAVVEVQAPTVELQTQDAVTGQVVNRKFVNDLPLVDRDFTNLTYLAPGITETNAPGSTESNGGLNFNSNGSRNSTADMIIDGASTTNFEQNSGIQNALYTPSVDTIEEFRVEQSNFTAEYGFAGGTIINVITRSGTNEFHGDAYEFFRNAVMDANDWFNNQAGTPIPPLKRNDFGVTAGGPIKKNKTFFFVDYEGVRQAASANSGPMGVPTLCERGDPSATCPVGTPALGNFGEICTTQGGSFPSSGPNMGQCVDSTGALFPAGQLWDPYTSVFNAVPFGNTNLPPGAVRMNFIPFNNLATYQSPGNPPAGNPQIPAGSPFFLSAAPGNLIDPVAANLFLAFAKPTVNATDFGTLQGGNFFSSGARHGNDNKFDIKVDHRFSDRDQLSVRYSQENVSTTDFNCFGNFADPCTGGPATSTRHLVAVNFTHTFSPTVVLTLTYGLVRGFDNAPGVKGQFPNIDSSFSQIGFPSYLNNGFGTIPAITLTGYSAGNAPSGNNIGTQPFSITREGQDAHHLEGAVSWLRGKHEFKFGAEGRMYRINHTNPGWPSGAFNFDTTSSNQLSSITDNSFGGDAMASFLMGVGSPSLTGGGCTPCQQGFNNVVSTQSFRYGVFAQDNYRVTPKLTLNLGLRYEISLPRTERYNRMNWLDPNALSPLQVAGLPPLHGVEVFLDSHHRHNYYTDYKDIQPRFGLAYQLPHAFVVRGGYGIYFSTPRNGASGTGPWGFEGYSIQPPWLPALNNNGANPWNTLKNTACLFTPPFQCGIALPPSTLRTFNAFNDIGNDAVGPIPSISQNTPYEQAWSFGFQKELPGRIVVDTSYVGKKGTHLYLGGLRNLDVLPPSAIAGMTPAQIGNLMNLVPNPFFFDPTMFPPGTACDPTRFICDPASGLSGPMVSQFQLMLPFPQFNHLDGDSPPIANSIYHALQVRVEKQFSQGLQFLLTYVWSKSIDNASATDDSTVFLGGGILGTGSLLDVQNPFDLRGERAVSVFDIPQILQLSYVYELPVGRGKWLGRNMNPVLNAIIGGWQTNGIIRIDDGRPILPLLLNPTPIPTYHQRPDLTATLERASGSPENFTTPGGPGYFANGNVLAQPMPFALGTAPRTITSARQPGARDLSMSLFKEFPLSKVREGMRLEFRAESFNTFNHPHFQGPDTNVGSSSFGNITSTVNTPREMQLALKLYW